MDTEGTNPYCPPATIREESRETGGSPPRWVFPLLMIGAISYHLFVLLLFLSPPDRRVSIWFLANTPVIVAWLLRWHQQRGHGAIFGIVASIVQLVIAVAILLVLDHADVLAVVGICGTIIAVFLALAWICHRQSMPAVRLVTGKNTANRPLRGSGEANGFEVEGLPSTSRDR